MEVRIYVPHFWSFHHRHSSALSVLSYPVPPVSTAQRLYLKLHFSKKAEAGHGTEQLRRESTKSVATDCALITGFAKHFEE